MDEQDFWVRLEYRVTAEFRKIADERLRRHWCDGMIAEDYDFGGPRPSVSGRAWCGDSGQEQWRFVLVLPVGIGSSEQVDWAALLPGDEVTGWLSVDPRARSLTVDTSPQH
ncbi:hypothetical protein [Actinoplanes couchii]|uniref:Uncharacterized protein n=1 Tax=Actinoplanes couchii TaxID=403638 RepID=A0ABQ3XNM4_9ACTN|nr:hypothetical protein [Actinoplanes couchii]MDR6319661.1 hypothetical protein [Actinoplanes couchii]GID60119.1 hypothetical protein Aco03nite_085230 [Actinoplanes couchii]